MNGTLSSKNIEKRYLSFFWVTILVFGIFVMLHPIYEVVASLFANMYQPKTDYIGLSSIFHAFFIDNKKDPLCRIISSSL